MILQRPCRLRVRPAIGPAWPRTGMAIERIPQARPYDEAELAALSDEQQFLLQHALTYGPGLDAGAWPDDAVLPVGNHTPPRWTHHPVGDAAGQWAALQAHLDRGVYRVISPMTGLEPRQKGTSKQVTLQPGIVFDIDTADGVHEPARSGLPDPTREQAREILAVFAGHGIRATFTLDTGGGYQAAVILDRPFSPRKDEDGARPGLPVKAAKALQAVCGSLGVACDVKLTKGSAYPMRVAGGFNRKAKPAGITEKMRVSGWTRERLDSIPADIADRPVRLVAVTAETMTADALEAALEEVIAAHAPARPEKPGKPAPPARPDRGDGGGYRHACGATDDPRDQVCLHLPMSRIVRELSRFAFEEAAGIPDTEDEDRRLTWADDQNTGTSAELVWRAHPDSGVTRCCVVPYGNSTSDMLGSAEQAPQCAYWYLRNAHCDGDRALADALVSRFAGNEDGGFDDDGLLAALEASLGAAEVRAAFPGLEEEFRASQAHGAPRGGSPDVPLEFERARASFDGQRIDLGLVGEKDCYVIVGGPLHGTWVAEQVWDAKAKGWREKAVQVWDAVAGTVDSVDYADGDTPEGEPLARAFIVDRWGRTARTPLMPVRDAYNPMKVWESLRAAKVSSPEGPDCKRAVATSLKILDTGGDSESFQTSMGWHVTRDGEGERWHYNGTVAGVSAAGAVPGVWRKKPRIERAGGAVIVHQAYVSACQRATGWPDVPGTADGVAEAAAWIGELRALTPGRPDLHLALLGCYFAAPLAGMRKKPAISLEGEPESFKSGLVASYHPFLTGLPVDDENLTVSLKAKFSKPGIDGLRRSWNDAVVVLDDAADNSDGKRNSDTAAVVDDAIKAAYGMADGAMADGAGGTDVRRSSRCAVIVTSEKPLEGLGVTSRTLVLRLAKGEVADNVAARLNPLIAAGLPRRLYAGYVRWLACFLDARGEDALRARVDAHKQALTARLGNVRAVDVAGGVYAGLMMLGEFLRAAGCRDALAPDSEIDAVMDTLTEEGKARNASAGIGAFAVGHIEGMLASGRGYLEGAAHLADSSEAPVPADSLAVDCGWRMDGENWRTKPGAVHLGYITDEDADGNRHVLITRSGLQAAWRSAGRAEKYTQALEAWKTGQSVPRFRGVDRPSVGLPGHPKNGVVFAPETLGIRSVPVEEQARRLADGSLPPAPADVVPPSGPEHPEPGPEPAPSPARVPAPRPARPQQDPQGSREPAAGEGAVALFPEPERDGPGDGGLFPETATAKKEPPQRPWTRKQIEAVARTVPRIWPDDLEEVDGIP